MSDPQTDDLVEQHESGNDFGDFYPVGHVLVALPTENDARTAYKALLAQGWDTQTCRFFDDRKVLQATQRGLETASVLSSIGSTMRMVQTHHNLAAEGCYFLLVKVDDDAATEKLMQVIRRQPFKLAQKYNRLTIETLD